MKYYIAIGKDEESFSFKEVEGIKLNDNYSCHVFDGGYVIDDIKSGLAIVKDIKGKQECKEYLKEHKKEIEERINNRKKYYNKMCKELSKFIKNKDKK